jgi:hypothetical protein
MLLITHPGGARSFDYEDRWDGTALIYTGRGKNGDQRLEGPNRDVAENRKQLFVLEAAGSKQLRYLGQAVCAAHWRARAFDATGVEREVLKFRLVFESAPLVSASPPDSARASPLRTARPFVPTVSPPVRAAEVNRRTTHEETAALQEKANQEHHRILTVLAAALTDAGWQELQEIPAAVDLWALPPGRTHRTIFEVKSLSDENEIGQCRAGLSQLIEYRFFYGRDEDRLCIAVNRPITDRRRVMLESLGVSVVVVAASGQLQPLGQLALEIVAPPRLNSHAHGERNGPRTW